MAEELPLFLHHSSPIPGWVEGTGVHKLFFPVSREQPSKPGDWAGPGQCHSCLLLTPRSASEPDYWPFPQAFHNSPCPTPSSQHIFSCHLDTHGLVSLPSAWFRRQGCHAKVPSPGSGSYQGSQLSEFPASNTHTAPAWAWEGVTRHCERTVLHAGLGLVPRPSL